MATAAPHAAPHAAPTTAPHTRPLPANPGLAINGGTPVSAAAVPFMQTALAQADIDAAVAVLKSGMLRAWKKCEELETRMAQMSSARHAMTCANGTCALQLAYEPLFERGDDVLVPAWTYIATVSMVVARGGNPIFVDALPDTMQIDMADAAKKITPRTRAIAATHLYGCPVDIDAVQALAAKHNLKVVCDAAQSHLATYKGKGIGAFGDAVTYSFYATKNLATGEGGMITCNDDALARQIKLLRSHGETDKYLHEQVGYNYRMNDITGAIGCSRLDRLEAETKKRQDAAARYDKILSSIPGFTTPKTTPGATSAYHLYIARIDPTKFLCTRDQFCDALKAEGVPTAVHYPRPLTRQPAFSQFVKDGGASCPIAENLCHQVFALPMHHGLTDEHFKTVEAALRKVADAYRA
ncbi:MAG: DegT/DnrJ/EryC1/StrS family aminotransferase [Phycisphaeraceae bacterium]|nr:DegT/DnrJ/EryC1/StrS family aminotransferase [Phycisphaeraceae bacterium]